MRRRRNRIKVVLESVVTMAQANIPTAGRLNPRIRRAGGVGDTLTSLGFAELSTENIPAAGKNVLRRLVPLRATIIADANLVLAEAGDVAVCRQLVEEYLGEVNKLGEHFEKV